MSHPRVYIDFKYAILFHINSDYAKYYSPLNTI